MNQVILPVLLPLASAVTLLLMGRPSAGRRWFAGISAGAQVAVAVWLLCEAWDETALVLPLGNWPAQAGIVLVIDLLSAIMLNLSSLIALACLLYGFAEMKSRIEHPLRLPLIQMLVAGINLSFCTGDLFNLFVGFEVMLIASYSLLTLEADDWDVKHAFPYVAINLVGSTLFIGAAGLAYSLFGTLNFAGIAMRAQEMAGDPRVLILAILLLLVGGIKAGLFPLYYWLPNSYPTLPFPVAALWAGMLTKVGVYVLLRLFGTVLPHDLLPAHQILAWLAGATMLLAVIGAISRDFIRGILSFHILSQIGFMVLAIGFFTVFSFAASIFYVVHHIIVKSSLFLIGGVACLLNRGDNLKQMGNLWVHAPWLGVFFLLQAFSLAGLPPLSGFWGKYAILVVGLEQREYVLVGICLAASLMTLFSMLKIWNSAFWNVSGQVEVRTKDRRWVGMTAVVAGMTALSLFIGLGAEPVMQLAHRAAVRVMDQPGYVQAVFSQTGKLSLP